MADTNTATIENLRAELDAMRAQMEKVLKSYEGKGKDAAEDMAHRIAREIEHYRNSAMQRAGQLRDAGQAGLDEVGEQVRRNPLLSLGVAFGVGVVVSALLRGIR